VTIRCAGFDAPELAQSYGAEARAALVDLVAGGVDMDPGSPDRYGRVVAYLRTVDGRDVAREMVSSGSAWWYRQYARGRADLGAAESSARAERRGLWARPGAVPPWEFRKGTRKPSKVYW
jgi:endonuclease YncB( thermonuclease family)